MNQAGSDRLWVNFCSGLFAAGLIAQGYGLFLLHGLWLPCAIVGSELALLGLAGVIRGAR